MLNRSSAQLLLVVCLGGLLLAATITSQGCSSSSGASDVTDLCTRGCAKSAQCFSGDAGGIDVSATCKADCMSQSAATCTNQSAIISAGNACLAMSDCNAFLTCIISVPKCQGGGGTGGSAGGGTGGSAGGGTGGSTGAAASCSSCDKAGACCVAIAALGGQSNAGCSTYSTATCNATAASSQAQFASTCAAVLQAGASVSASCR
jgi:hypothetical protein